MRLALGVALGLGSLLAACGPKVSTAPLKYDEDLGGSSQVAPPATTSEELRPVAPPGKGLRTGVIQRDRLLAVLDAGPASFLRQLEVTPRMNGERFVGWQLVQLIDRTGPLVDVDVVPGDVLLAINGKPLSRPDQLQSVWDSLRTANTLQAQLWRGEAKFAIEFAVEPAVAASAMPVTAPTPAPAMKPAPAPAQPPVQLDPKPPSKK